MNLPHVTASSELGNTEEYSFARNVATAAIIEAKSVITNTIMFHLVNYSATSYQSI